MGLMDELKKLTHPYRDEEDDYDDFDDEPVDEEESAPAAQPASRRSYSRETRSTATSRVVNLNSNTALQVVLVKPDRFDQVSEIADHLRSKQAIVLNLETTNKDVSRRLVDFLSGCAYALDGKIKKVAVSTYLITPYNVDVVGDLVEELETSGIYF